MEKSRNNFLSFRFTTTLLLLVISFVLFNINFNAGAAIGQIYGEGTVGFLAKWITPVLYRLTVTKAGTGTGTVISNPAGVDCAPACPSDFGDFGWNTVVDLTATPTVGSYFAGWNGGGCLGPGTPPGTCQITMAADTPVTATFTLVIPPTVSGVSLLEANYCNPGPIHTLDWNYTDTNTPSSPQNGYQVQVDNNSDFSSPTLDTCPGGPPNGTCGGGGNSQTYPISQGDLAFNTIYYVRVMVWNSYGVASSWGYMATCTGTPSGPSGCQAGNTSWRTPVNAYPDVNPSNYDFLISPSAPSKGSPVQFTDRTNFYDGANPSQHDYLWDFGDGNSCTGNGNSNCKDPVNTYVDEGTYFVTLVVTDDNGYSCTTIPAKQVNVSKEIPIWKEVRPFN